MLTGRAIAVGFGLALLLSACGAPRPEASGPTDHDRTLVVHPADGRLWVTSPDDDAVVALDPRTLVERTRIPVAGAPSRLAIRADGRLAVTLAQATEIALVDPATGAVERRPVPCGGTRGVLARGDGAVLVSCPNDDRLAVVPLDPAAPATVVRAPGRPTALARNGDVLAYGASRAGRLVRLDWRTLRPLPEGETALETRRGFAAVQVDAVVPVPGGRTPDDFVVAFQRVDHDSDRGRDPARGGYGSVFDGEPRIEPRLAGACAERYARFDGGRRVASGPSALAWDAERGLLWVAHRYTDNVLVLDCDETDGQGRAALRAVFRVGRGPRGIALDRGGRVAFVDVGFAHAVARLELPARDDGGVSGPAAERVRSLGATRLSARALRGRDLFHDAVNTHLTPSGVVTCATCHPDGGEDGLRWFLHTRDVPRKLRRTPPAYNAGPATRPLHWDGEFADGGTLARATIRALMEGDGLLVDTGAIGAYMAELPPPPGRPLEPTDAALAERGRAVFASACADCHPPPHFTDGRAHAVLAPSADPDGARGPVHTPSLRGVRARPPYFHDGRAPTLEAALSAHGGARDLDPEERRALIRYLETL